MAKDIGVGVVGLGMGRNVLHVNGFGDSRLVVRGICDTDEALLKRQAEAFDIGFATADYMDLDFCSGGKRLKLEVAIRGESKPLPRTGLNLPDQKHPLFQE